MSKKRIFLTLWRNKTADQLYEQHDLRQELVAFLASRYEPESGIERGLLSRCLRHDADAGPCMLELARRTTPGFASKPSDLAMTWVLAAALAAHEPACLVLAQVLACRGQETASFGWPRRPAAAAPAGTDTERSAERAAARLRLIAQSWLVKTNTSFLMMPGRWIDALQKPSLPPARLGRGASQAGMPAAPAAPATTIQIVSEIGHAETEDFSVTTAWRHLTEPFPLRGDEVPTGSLRAALALEFPHMIEAIDHIVGDLELRRRAGAPGARFRPVLLVGPPGTGKTRLARRVARLLGTGFGETSLAGVSDNRMLEGTARGWRGAQPAWPILVIARTNCANPVLLLDELDKAGASRSGGDPNATLLGMLEPETAAAWYDACLLAPVNLVNVSWIFTANEVRPLPPPLLSRLSVIKIRPPTADQLDGIVAGIRRDIADGLGIAADLLPPTDGRAMEALRILFRLRPDVRILQRAIERLLKHTPWPARSQH